MPRKRGPYRTRAAAAADEAIALRLAVMDEGPTAWLRFCHEALDGGHVGNVRPHGKRRVERAAVQESLRRSGLSISAVDTKFRELEKEWSAMSRRVILDSPYHIGTYFGPTFIDECLHGPRQMPVDWTKPPPDADPRENPFPPMVRGEPWAPPSVRADTHLFLAWVEWLGQRERANELVNEDNRSAVTRARRRIRGASKYRD